MGSHAWAVEQILEELKMAAPGFLDTESIQRHDQRTSAEHQPEHRPLEDNKGDEGNVSPCALRELRGCERADGCSDTSKM